MRFCTVLPVNSSCKTSSDNSRIGAGMTESLAAEFADVENRMDAVQKRIVNDPRFGLRSLYVLAN